jgi:hypothetical protein
MLNTIDRRVSDLNGSVGTASELVGALQTV